MDTEKTANGAGESSPAPDGSAHHPAEYVYGMAPRTDATDKGLANRNAREQYIIMRAHARALEIELQEALEREHGADCGCQDCRDKYDRDEE